MTTLINKNKRAYYNQQQTAHPGSHAKRTHSTQGTIMHGAAFINKRLARTQQKLSRFLTNLHPHH